MQLIKNNPYRIVGLLVGAKAAIQTKQITNLKMYLDAEQEPQEDFSFPVLGKLNRTIDIVLEAAAKLHLDSDKMNAALFWFYNGNLITDEPAFDFLKEGKVKDTASIWTKLVKDKPVELRNASAFHNLSTLFLNHAFKDDKIKEDLFEDGIWLKLQFLESEYANDFKNIATGETYRTSKKEMQLVFLNSIMHELEKLGGITIARYIEIINKISFTAKDEFLKSFVSKPIDEIEKKITEVKNKRKNTPSDAEIYGKELIEDTEGVLKLLSDILGIDNIKYQSIADKLANEILQCGIDFFKEFKDEEYDPSSESMDLFLKAADIAVGNIIKQRITENTENLQEWIDGKPLRDKIKQIEPELEFLYTKLERFQSLADSVENAKDLIFSCKPRILKIKSVIGKYDELYLNFSNAVVQNAQNMLVQAVNETVSSYNANSYYNPTTTALENTLKSALDTTFNMGTFDMQTDLREHYNVNLGNLKTLAKQLGISVLTPKEITQNSILNAEKQLAEIQNSVFLQREINNANSEMERIKEWHFGRSQADRERQIANQQQIIEQLKRKSGDEKAKAIILQQNKITELKNKLNQLEY